MFTGIIEDLGVIEKLELTDTNLDLTVSSKLSKELKVDQSIAHNGVCLTVVEQDQKSYRVTAIQETLDKSNLGELVVGDTVNLERCLQYGGRIDGHVVQGHVDTTGKLVDIQNLNGSWKFTVEFDPGYENLVIDKGSITINGVSLTVVDPERNRLSVAIIPFTFEHTTFKRLKKGDTVNLEFDVLGKYIAKHAEKLLA